VKLTQAIIAGIAYVSVNEGCFEHKMSYMTTLKSYDAICFYEKVENFVIN